MNSSTDFISCISPDILRLLKQRLYFMGRSIGLFHFTNRLFRQHLLILAYHGFELDDETLFRPGLFIKQSTFRARLEAIGRSHHRVMPLDDAISNLFKGTLSSKALVITIDDGFYSTYAHAMPLLKTFGFPATVFMTTYYMNINVPIFRLAIQYMFWKTRHTIISLDGACWTSIKQADLTLPELRNTLIWQCIDYGERCHSEKEREGLCLDLAERLGISYTDIQSKRILSLMTAQEVQDISHDGFDIELHTHRHRLPHNNQSDVISEINDNRSALSLINKNFPRHLCYPSGLWNKSHWPWLDSLGIMSSVTCDIGLNDCHTPRHALKRFLDSENVEQIEFDAEIAGYAQCFRRIHALGARPRIS
jgi:peptidoglycan/xylan/chitin deacetylase (PgdA/CDA1 family)